MLDLLFQNLMYDFHYNSVKNFFDAKLLFTDTDCLTYEIKSEDVYEDFYKDQRLLDLSNYAKDSKFFNPVTEKVIGKMKDGHKGNQSANLLEQNQKYILFFWIMIKNLTQQKE